MNSPGHMSAKTRHMKECSTFHVRIYDEVSLSVMTGGLKCMKINTLEVKMKFTMFHAKLLSHLSGNPSGVSDGS